MTSAFFTSRGGEFVPAAHAHSPWSPGMLHGRLLGGLAARAVEARYGDPGLHVARLTVDLFRNSPLLPVTVDTALVRDGRRIRVADATIRTEQGVIGRAAAVLLRTGEQPDNEHLLTAPWDETPPDGPPPASQGWDPPFDMWWVPGRRRMWMREDRPLVDDEQLTPIVRTALAGDFASPLTAMAEGGVAFINADYTLTLARLPEGELIGMEATGRIVAAGVSTGQVTLHDTAGPFGFCVVTALANPVPLRG
ncbi:thioesterase family protein [Nonomuraea sp. CA-218870]|uniref:thioesterase family protein n=1 Tax=Nonomuraea sp. CA-218870 TaxID=3239998 RepID=UPI003D904FC5